MTLIVGKSSISGVGIFTTRNIRRGSWITTMRGRLHRKKYRQQMELRVGHNWVPINTLFWIEPRFPVRYINHSCEPNAGFTTPTALRAMRAIKKGEEITLDYSSIEHVRIWNMDCICGSAKCRGSVRSIQFLPDESFRDYLPYVPKFMRELRLS